MKKLLLVDDDENVLESLFLSLQDFGYSVSARQNATAAASLLEGEEYDILITDLQMPGMDGYELASYASRLWPSLRVIVITALDPPAVVTAWITLFKPFGIEELVALIERAE